MSLKETLLSTNLNYEQSRRAILKIRDMTTITSFIKIFFHTCLNEPILTFSGLNKISNVINDVSDVSGLFMEESGNQNHTHTSHLYTLDMIKQVLKNLPKCNIETLSLTMLHLQAVKSNFGMNNMTLDLLSHYIGSVIIGFRSPKPSGQELMRAKIYLGRVGGANYKV